MILVALWFLVASLLLFLAASGPREALPGPPTEREPVRLGGRPVDGHDGRAAEPDVVLEADLRALDLALVGRRRAAAT